MVKTLSIIGVGAFGEFILKYVTPYFKVVLWDRFRDLSHISNTYNVTCGTIEDAARCHMVVISVPVKAIESVAKKISALLRPTQLVMDVTSVKCLPTKILKDTLPSNVEIVSLHPLFGPQSGNKGIYGQNIAVVNVQGKSSERVSSFLATSLGLNVIRCTAQEHDEQMAYVQGLTHMIAGIFKKMNMPKIYQYTDTFSLLCKMVDLVKNDSDALFHAIQTDNPYVKISKKKFFDAVQQVEKDLSTRSTQ